MNGVTITVDAHWITVEGLNLSPIMIPRKDSLAFAKAIRVAVREREEEEAMRKKMDVEQRAAELEEKRRERRGVYFSSTVKRLLREMTREQQRLAVAAHKRHVAACAELQQEPESLLKFLEEWSKPEQVRSEEWTPQTIGEGLCRQRYWQYASGRREQAA